MKLLFVRHGHPDYGTDTLTEKGHPQAEAAAQRLLSENINVIYSSSCGRAVQTAEHTAKLLGLPITRLDFMREIAWGVPGSEYGSFYHPWDAAKRLAQSGIDLLHYDPSEDPVWKDSRLSACTEFVQTEFDRWLSGLGYEREGVHYRCTRENNDVVALFSHGGSSSAAMSHLLGVPMLYFCSVYILNFTSITVFEFDGNVGDIVIPNMALFNDDNHIRHPLENVFC